MPRFSGSSIQYPPNWGRMIRGYGLPFSRICRDMCHEESGRIGGWEAELIAPCFAPLLQQTPALTPGGTSPSLKPLLCHRREHMVLRKSQKPQRSGVGNVLYAAPLRNRIFTNSSAISNLGKAFTRQCSGGSGHPPHRCWGMGCSLPGERNQNTIYDHLFPTSCPSKPQPCPPNPGSVSSTLWSLTGRHQHRLSPAQREFLCWCSFPVWWQTPTPLHSWKLKCTSLDIKLDQGFTGTMLPSLQFNQCLIFR